MKSAEPRSNAAEAFVRGAKLHLECGLYSQVLIMHEMGSTWSKSTATGLLMMRSFSHGLLKCGAATTHPGDL